MGIASAEPIKHLENEIEDGMKKLEAAVNSLRDCVGHSHHELDYSGGAGTPGVMVNWIDLTATPHPAGAFFIPSATQLRPPVEGTANITFADYKAPGSSGPGIPQTAKRITQVAWNDTPLIKTGTSSPLFNALLYQDGKFGIKVATVLCNSSLRTVSALTLTPKGDGTVFELVVGSKGPPIRFNVADVTPKGAWETFYDNLTAQSPIVQTPEPAQECNP